MILDREMAQGHDNCGYAFASQAMHPCLKKHTYTINFQQKQERATEKDYDESLYNNYSQIRRQRNF